MAGVWIVIVIVVHGVSSIGSGVVTIVTGYTTSNVTIILVCSVRISTARGDSRIVIIIIVMVGVIHPLIFYTQNRSWVTTTVVSITPSSSSSSSLLAGLLSRTT